MSPCVCVFRCLSHPAFPLSSFPRNCPEGAGAGRGAIADPSNLEKALLQVLPAARHERKRGSQVRPKSCADMTKSGVLGCVIERPGRSWPRDEFTQPIRRIFMDLLYFNFVL